MNLRTQITSAVLGISLACSSALATEFEAYQGSATWDQYDQLPDTEKWAWMYQEAHEIADDLNSAKGKYKLVYKSKGGSSHQVLVVRTSDEKVMALWSAPNHATYILGEIFAFNLARLLGRSEWAMPGTRMTLTGAGRDMAYQALSAEAPAARACNRAHILAYMQANPHYIVGVYKSFLSQQKPQDIPEIVDRVDQKRLNPQHPLVQMIQSEGPRPRSQLVYLSDKGTLSFSQPANEIARAVDTDLAKQLSFMALVDALNSQRDCFGPYGSNMQAMLNQAERTFNISLIDNGGVADAAQTLSLKYFVGTDSRPGVSRFEKEVFDKVLALDDFLSGRQPQFMNYHSIDELKRALGYEMTPSTMGSVGPVGDVCRSEHMFLFAPLKTRWDKRWNAFSQAVKFVAAHMRKYQTNPNAFFE